MIMALIFFLFTGRYLNKCGAPAFYNVNHHLSQKHKSAFICIAPIHNTVNPHSCSLYSFVSLINYLATVGAETSEQILAVGGWPSASVGWVEREIERDKM